jgi:hypothetical protein
MSAIEVGSEWQERGVPRGPIVVVLGIEGRRKVRLRWTTDHGWRTGEMERGAFIAKFRRASCGEGG